MADLLIRGARLVPFRSRTRLAALRMSGAATPPAPLPGPAPEPVDVLVRDGVVAQVGAGPGAGEPGGAGRAGGLRVLEAGGAFLIPGLWDAHAHLDLEAARQARLDTAAT
ncbi:MAG: amidohydrolase, partial [Actinomyces bowdenii]|nr:amidohydrolase [Actinomyces bowdenii]